MSIAISQKEQGPSNATVTRWAVLFKNGRESIEYDPLVQTVQLQGLHTEKSNRFLYEAPQSTYEEIETY